MKIALIGNPNCGKTTLFNALTGLRQKVGNWSGVTVEKKSGKYINDKSIIFIDLPGTYSIDPLSPEEKLTNEFLIKEKPDCIINVVDSTNLNRNLFLTTQLLTLNIPMVLALNMSDRLKVDGILLDSNKLSAKLGIPTVNISAVKGKGIDKLVNACKNAKSPKLTIDCDLSIVAEKRYKIIERLLSDVLVTGQSKEKRITAIIDKILTNKYLAFPIFIIIIWAVYYLSVQMVGGLTSKWLLNLLVNKLGAFLSANLANSIEPWLMSLLVDGIVLGVGTVLSFVPQIITLFFFITLLESCGYMARVAYIMDKIFRSSGLSGKSIIPMVVGCGCSVPAVMSARTVDRDDERRLTIMLTPFIPCSAKLPLFVLFCSSFFPENPFIAPSMYLLSLAVVFICGKILTVLRVFERQDDTFLLELPPYRLPSFKSVAVELWDKTRGFIVKASTVIFVASIILWALESFDTSFTMVGRDKSMLADLGKLIGPLFKPLGFSDWRLTVSILSGIAAKENIVATLSLLLCVDGLPLTTALNGVLNPSSALSFMVFILLASPCIATLSATKKELGSWGALGFAMFFQTSTAYIVAFVIYRLSILYYKNSVAFLSVVIAIMILLICWAILRKLYKDKKCHKSCKNCKNQCKSKNK